jgi:HlyD family secretion protein
MSKWNLFIKARPAKGKTAIDYLPDADEIERSPLPRFAQFTMHILLVGLTAFGAWAYFSELDKVVIAKGSLINPLPNIVVQPLETGMIKTVSVRVGQVVKKNDVLATLDATFIQADENQLRMRLTSLETQASGLEQELSGRIDAILPGGSSDDKLQASLLLERRANYTAQKNKMLETAGKLRAALATNRNDRTFAVARLRSLKEMELTQEKLVAQKYGVPIQLLEAQLRSKDVERELEALGNREREILRELAAFESERTAFEKGWRQKTMEELLSVSRERDALKEQLQKIDRRHKLVTLVAPVDAVVLDILKLSPGSIVREAETFFTLVPLNVALEAEVYIDAQDIGYVKRDHPVHLKVDAYPFQRHGTLDAKIRTISEDAFRRGASDRAAPDVYYLSRIELGEATLKNMGDGARLLPGMTLSAEIVVGQRTIISYLAWPLLKGLSESAREP